MVSSVMNSPKLLQLVADFLGEHGIECNPMSVYLQTVIRPVGTEVRVAWMIFCGEHFIRVWCNPRCGCSLTAGGLSHTKDIPVTSPDSSEQCLDFVVRHRVCQKIGE